MNLRTAVFFCLSLVSIIASAGGSAPSTSGITRDNVPEAPRPKSFIERVAEFELSGSIAALTSSALVSITPMPSEFKMASYGVIFLFLVLYNLLDPNKSLIPQLVRLPLRILGKLVDWSIYALYQVIRFPYTVIKFSIGPFIGLGILMLMCQPLRLFGIEAPHELTFYIAKGAYETIPFIINYPFKFIKEAINSRAPKTITE